jgi:hypothetical protein
VRAFTIARFLSEFKRKDAGSVADAVHRSTQPSISIVLITLHMPCVTWAVWNLWAAFGWDKPILFWSRHRAKNDRPVPTQMHTFVSKKPKTGSCTVRRRGCVALCTESTRTPECNVVDLDQIDLVPKQLIPVMHGVESSSQRTKTYLEAVLLDCGGFL